MTIESELRLIPTIAYGLGFATIGGMVTHRLGLPPLVGYLLAGIAIGPYTPGFVAEVELADQLAQLGIILMMFGVGMHFSVGDLLAVRSIAIPGAILQIAVATAMGMAAGWAWGWPVGHGLVFGLSLSVASTVVLLRALEARDLLKSENGRIAVGWLIVEDLVLIVVLILFPALAYALGAETGRGATAEGANAEAVAPGEVVWKLARTLTQLGLFVAFMLLVGMLFDPGILLRQPLQILLVVAIILVAKTVAAAVLVRLLGRPWHTALLISVALAQIGEFSFLLGSLGLAYGLLSKEGQNLIVAGSLLSIMLNPALFAALDAWVTPGPNSEPHPASAG